MTRHLITLACYAIAFGIILYWYDWKLMIAIILLFIANNRERANAMREKASRLTRGIDDSVL